MVHALLLARAGIEVTVLEKHNDFLRDFRGDTVHPSTLRIMDELGLIDEFLRLPHTKVNRLAFDTDGTLRTFGNFSALSRLGFKQPYIALMPQWDFLDFLAEKASAYPEFTLIRNAEVTDLIFDGRSGRRGAHPGPGGAFRPRDRRRRAQIGGTRRGGIADRELEFADRRLVVPAELASG